MSCSACGKVIVEFTTCLELTQLRSFFLWDVLEM